jgi:membrane-associated phospholipid phosphatase
MTPRTLPRPGLRQLALFGGVYLLYLAGRWLTGSDMDAALQHAHWVVSAEGGLAIERNVQDALGNDVVMTLLSNVYLAAQLIVLPASLFFLYKRSQPVYRRLRDTVIATWLLALPIYALFPTAPPRLAGLGIADTVSSQAGVALTGHSTVFYNPIAAVPSLHCGFAFAIGIALYKALKNPVARAAALAWGPLVSLSVVATGNHYLFDVAAGILAALAGFAARPALERLATTARPRLLAVPA